MSTTEPPVEIAGLVTITWPMGTRLGQIVAPATVEVRDALTGESLVGVTRVVLDIDFPGGEIIAQITEIIDVNRQPIRSGTARTAHEMPTLEYCAWLDEHENGDGFEGEKCQTVTRRFLLAPAVLDQAKAAA